MAKPARPSDPKQATGQPRTFFVTTRTVGGKSLFQATRMAELLIDVLRSCVKARRFTIHDFVIMPNHLHLLITIPGNVTVERAMQWVKGIFSFRARKELGFTGEIWQRGFSDVRIIDERSFQEYQAYIDANPVKGGLASTAEEYLFGTAFLKRKRKQAGAKAQFETETCGTTKVVP
jgi:putative transposase